MSHPRRLADLASHNCLRYAFHPFGDEWRFIGPCGSLSIAPEDPMRRGRE